MAQVQYRYDLFVSYAEADHAWVEGYLLPALGLSEERIITQYDFIPGPPVVKQFTRAVNESRYTVLVLTPAYLADQWAGFGGDLVSYLSVETEQDRLIPLVRQDCKIPLDIKYRVRLDCTGSERTKWEHEVARLRKLLNQPEQPTEPEIACPYPGMVPFSEADSKRFYGRDEEIQKLVQRLRLHPLIAVIGPSGSGKSSLVFAGLIPALRKSKWFGQDSWLVRTLRPGEQPIKALAETLRGNPFRPKQAVPNLLAKDSDAQRLLLIVDQFEELFTTANMDERPPFQKSIIQLAKVPNCVVVLTMRADFFDDMMKAPIWPAIQAHRMEVLPLNAKGLREAIEKPAKEVDVVIEPALVERLVDHAASEPGALPLVQETLVLLWERRERRYLPLSAYETLGDKERTGLQVAMARRADVALAHLSAEQQAIAQRIFLRLVQFGEGRADTRRQQSVDQLRALEDNEVLFEQTLRHLTQKRLLTSRAEAKGIKRKVDIAHEALITGWPTFQQWVKQWGKAEQTRRRLESKAAEWVRLGRKQGGLLDEVEFEEAEEWLATPLATEVGHSSDLKALLASSRQAVLKARQRDLEEQQRHEKEQRKQARRRTLLLIGLGMVVIVIILMLLPRRGWQRVGQLPALPGNNAGKRLSRVGELLFISTNTDFTDCNSHDTGLWRSSDKGVTWTAIEVPLLTKEEGNRCGLALINAFAADPNLPERIYATTKGNISTPGAGLLRSDDSGLSWQRVFTNSLPEDLVDVVVLSDASGTVLVTATADELYRSSDEGASWELLNEAATCSVPSNSLPADLQASVLLATPDAVFVASGTDGERSPNQSSGLYVSDDGGDCWQQVHDGQKRYEYQALHSRAKQLLAILKDDQLPLDEDHIELWLLDNEQGRQRKLWQTRNSVTDLYIEPAGATWYVTTAFGEIVRGSVAHEQQEQLPSLSIPCIILTCQIDLTTDFESSEPLLLVGEHVYRLGRVPGYRYLWP